MGNHLSIAAAGAGVPSWAGGVALRITGWLLQVLATGLIVAASVETLGERQLSRRDVPLREKTLWRMLYETAARASEILALDIDDLDLPGRRATVISKGGDTEWVHWASGTAHLLPRLLRGRAAGPVFLSHRRPAPSRRPPTRDLCPDTGKARLGYDRARILFGAYTGWELHQLRHSAATHLGEHNVPLQTIMAKTRHRNPRTALRYIRPSAQAVAHTTEELLDLGRHHP